MYDEAGLCALAAPPWPPVIDSDEATPRDPHTQGVEYYNLRPFRHDCFRTDTHGLPFSSSITQAGHMMQKMPLCLAAVNHLPDRRVVRRFGKIPV